MEGEGGKITLLQSKISSGVISICIIYKPSVNLSNFLQALQLVLLPLHTKGQKIIVMSGSNNKKTPSGIYGLYLTAKVKESISNYSTCIDYIYTMIELECGVAEIYSYHKIYWLYCSDQLFNVSKF